MRASLPGRFIIVCAFLVTSIPRGGRAQSPVGSSGRIRPIAAWVSAGLGPAHIDASPNSTLAAVARASVSAGPLMLTYRRGDVTPLWATGPGVRSDAVLAGARSSGRRVFGSASLGYARAARYHHCQDCGPTTWESGVGELAYDLALHANAMVPGIALNLSGNLGPSRGLHSALTFELELGWFGH